MLKPEEKAISLFNSAIKIAINLELEPNKFNAKEIVYIQLDAIKEALYDATLMDDAKIKKSTEYWQKVKSIIENI